MKSYQWLNGVASVLAVIGWIVVVIGVFLLVKGLSASNEMGGAIAGLGLVSGISAIMSGLLLVLAAGAVQVLISIEENTRPVRLASGDASNSVGQAPISGLEM